MLLSGCPPRSGLASEDAYSNQKAYKLNAGYTMDALKLGATYEKISNVKGADGSDQADCLVSAAYGMGPITLAAQYGVKNSTGDHNSLKDFTAGAVYSLSKRTSIYPGYAHYKMQDSTGDSKVNVVTLGLNHDF
jgi:predicted porin